MKRSIFAVALLAPLLNAKPGLAQDAKLEARARKHYASGTSQFDAGKYREALAEFAAGYELSHKPGFLWNMAEAARLSGDRERALDLYKKYVREAPTGPQRSAADARIKELTPTQSAAPPATPITPGLKESSTERGAAPPLPEPLVPRVTTTSTLTAETGSGADTASTPIYQRWWFWTGAGALVAGAVVTAVIVATSAGVESPAKSTKSGTTVDWTGK